MTPPASEATQDQTELLADESGQACRGVPVAQPAQGQVPPNNHSFLAWFSCLCFCWLIGVFAISTSHDVDYKWARGDFEGARQASKRTKSISVAAIVVGIVYGFWYFAYFAQPHSTAGKH